MSERMAQIIEIKKEIHPYADSLSLVHIGDFTCVIRSDDWIDGQKAVYIEPDSIVDTSKPEFNFLAIEGQNKVRVKARKLRQIWSMGLLVPYFGNLSIGDNAYNELGVEHYEPEEHGQTGGTTSTSAPPMFSHLTKYDVENGRKSAYSHMFYQGEQVYITEKIHGQNMAAVWTDGQYHIKSRNEWKLQEPTSLYWRSLLQDEALMKWLRDNPDTVIYGEQYGHNKGYAYDCKPGEVKFRAFDIRLKDGTYVDAVDFVETMISNSLPTVPIYGNYDFDMSTITKMAEGRSLLGAKILEGIVVKPLKERRDPRHGRVVIKVVNPAYLEKN